MSVNGYTRQGLGGGERFKVTSISGFSIIPDCHSLDIYGKWRTEWYVVDKFAAYRIVATFNRKNAEQLARKLCHRLNVEERRWEVTGR